MVPGERKCVSESDLCKLEPKPDDVTVFRMNLLEKTLMKSTPGI